MSTLQTISAARTDAIIADLVSHEARAVLSSHCSEGWRTCGVTFVAGSEHDAAIRVQLEVTPETQGWETLKPGETVGVTFRLGHKKCMFSPTVHSVAQQGNRLVVTLSRPKGMHQLKRRVYHRALPPPDVVVPVRFWGKESSAPAEREARDVRHGQLEDISAGGMRVKTADCTDVEVGTTYECVFAPRQGASALILDATLRHREAVDQGRVSLGFQFIGFETSAEGRRALDRLARIVTQFRRVNHPAG